MKTRTSILGLLSSAIFVIAPIQAMAIAPTVSATPKLNKAARQSASAVSVTLQDLPAGFEEIPEEVKPQIAQRLEPLKRILKRENMPLNHFFAFVNPSNMEVVFGLTGTVANPSAQAKFDAALQQVQQPKMQQQLVQQARTQLKTYQGVEIVNSQPLPDLNNNLGNASTGLRVALTLQGQPLHIDVAGFRRNTVGAFTAVLDLDGAQPLTNVKDVASKLDKRILQAS